MKPIKLVMSAFGSYGGVEEIDFRDMKRGIFLITGDTGAGKTTVFDAITYALFDETSGGKRDGDMMRSQFADEGTPTYVELVFSYGGEEYCVRRNPNYQRISKRKNKDGEYTYTTEVAAVELTLPDGSVFPGKSRETNEKIKEILGVDVNQFTQISMIAQGEFLKLLHAPSKERKEIFSRIFDTKIYWQIQNRLKEQSKDLYIELSNNLLLLKRELENVQCPQGEEKLLQEKLASEQLELAWQQAMERVETGKEEIFTLLKEMEALQKEQEAQLQKQETACEEQLHHLKLQMAQAEEINGRFVRKQETEKSVVDIEQKLKTLAGKLAEWNEHKKELEKALAERMPKLEQQLAEARNLLPKYEQLEQRQNQAKEFFQRRELAAKELTEVQKQEEQQKQTQELLQKNQKELEPQLEQLSGLQQQEKELIRQQTELAELMEIIGQTVEYKKQMEESGAKVSEAVAVHELRSREYERCNRIFIEEQAGVLASELEEGLPCPVCGSTSHPKKADLSKEAVTQQQVEVAKERLSKAQAMLEQEREKFLSYKQQYESQRHLMQNQGERLLGQNWTEKNALEITRNALADCKTQLKELSERCRGIEKLQLQYRKQEEQLAETNQRLQQLSGQKEQRQNKYHEENLLYEKARQSLEELMETLSYPSKEALEEHLGQLEREKQQLEGKQQTIWESIQTLKQQEAKGEGALEEQKKNLELLIKELEEKEPVDISSYSKQERELLTNREALEQKKLMLISVKNGNGQAEKNLEELYCKREVLMEQYRVAETLSRTANGNLRQQVRLDLQTYVQRRYFRHIIGEANRRLIKMSSGRFILQCRDLEQLGRQGEAGLDLDVYDMVTDKVRDVKTLSGGESFLASLSMALGMADVIQKNAGKVHLDTMFIDEGFGSLDEEARGKAIQILQELAGETRLVGIISHVTEMKEQMDRKLVISKGEKGSHASWQIEG